MFNSAHTIDKEQNSGNAYLIVIQLQAHEIQLENTDFKNHDICSL